jgi:hypothetical protein
VDRLRREHRAAALSGDCPLLRGSFFESTVPLYERSAI